MEKNKKNLLGFTLIELLVVISIIGFIAAVAVASLNSARKQARDTSRAANITTLRKALDMYLDKNQGFPASAGECLSDTAGIGVTLKSSITISKIPSDPFWAAASPSTFNGGAVHDYAVSPSANFCYWYYSNNTQTYKLSYYLESSSNAGTAGIHVYSQAGQQ